MNQLHTLILAAGQGTRMRSEVAKVLHPILDKPMIFHVVSSVLQLQPAAITLVIGHQADRVEAAVASLFPEAIHSNQLGFVCQSEQRGTAHAVWCARQQLAASGQITLILNGDGPLITSESLAALIQTVASQQAALGLLTFKPESPHGYGRILRNSAGELIGIVEQRDASPQQQQIQECCAGIYAFRTAVLLRLLDTLMQEKPQHEYYLTDLVALAQTQGAKLTSLLSNDPHECLGVNDLEQLSFAEKLLQQRLQHA